MTTGASGILAQKAGMETTSASSSKQGGVSDGVSVSVTANDFLTLLVTEMKNQDPTANTDPNEYINQLVQVNSLQQLIAINQTLSEGLGGRTTPSADARSTSDVYRSEAAAAVPGLAAISNVGGNLSLPAANSSASRVASSMTTR